MFKRMGNDTVQHVEAWYFAEESRRLRYGDGRTIVVGDSHSVDGELILCENGLHASERIIDALQYAPGPILYRVILSGDMVQDATKIASRTRTYIWELDVTDILGKFARRLALVYVDLLRPHCSETGFNTIIKWLVNNDPACRDKVWDAIGPIIKSQPDYIVYSAARVVIGANPVSWVTYDVTSSAQYTLRRMIETAARIETGSIEGVVTDSEQDIRWKRGKSAALDIANNILERMVIQAIEGRENKSGTD